MWYVHTYAYIAHTRTKLFIETEQKTENAIESETGMDLDRDLQLVLRSLEHYGYGTFIERCIFNMINLNWMNLQPLQRISD